MGKYGGIVRHVRQDEFGPIEVVEALGLRSLHFGTAARQSSQWLAEPERLEMPYLRAMLAGLPFVAHPRRCLLLGLGGGSLAGFILRHCHDALVDAVEYRPAMVEVARDYFGLPESPRLRIHLADAHDYLRRHAGLRDGDYDLILVDLFDERGLAPCVLRDDFLAALTAALSPVGVLTVNLWSGETESFRLALRMLQRHFPLAHGSLPVLGRGNVIGLGLGDEARSLRPKVLQERAKRLEQQTGVEFSRLLQRLELSLSR
jgi:spermidine synthase